jgi:hypothetical protein
MKYTQKSFSVGGYSKEGRNNWDKIFGKKSNPDMCSCGKLLKDHPPGPPCSPKPPPGNKFA